MKRLFVPIFFCIFFALPGSAEEAVINGFRMYYEVRGRGEPVVLIHGFSLDSRMWEQQRELGKRYRVIVADMRYHGRSAIPEKSANDLPETAEDVRGLLDHLKIDRAHLVGLSMGGIYVLETALRYPERVRSLTLVASGIQGVPMRPEVMARFMKRLELYKEKGAAAFRENWLSDPVFAEVSKKPDLRKRLEAMVGDFKVDAYMRAFATMKMPSPPSQLDRLPTVKVPTLVMMGEADQPDMLAAGEAATKGIPGARKIVYPATGHMINMEQPQRFNRDLQKFLVSIPARP